LEQLVRADLVTRLFGDGCDQKGADRGVWYGRFGRVTRAAKKCPCDGVGLDQILDAPTQLCIRTTRLGEVLAPLPLIIDFHGVCENRAYRAVALVHKDRPWRRVQKTELSPNYAKSTFEKGHVDWNT